MGEACVMGREVRLLVFLLSVLGMWCAPCFRWVGYRVGSVCGACGSVGQFGAGGRDRAGYILGRCDR
jgi:hypothetical protein